MNYASGKHAWGICDICGLRTPYIEMRNQVINEAVTGLRVCKDCYDPDHPQLRVGKYPVYDPEALEHPRGETLPTIDTPWTPPWE